MKRFTETDKWKDPWFRSLKGVHKLVFLYLIENCNNAGFYEIDLDMMVMQIGVDKAHIEGAFKALEKSVIIRDGWVFLRTFLKHQKNDGLTPSNPAHRQIIAFLLDQLERFSDVDQVKLLASPFQGPSKGLASPIGKGQVKVKDKGSAEGGTPEQIIDDLRENPAYAGIDLDRELGKMKAWLVSPQGKGRRLTHRFMLNWLNKCEPTLGIGAADLSPQQRAFSRK